MYNYHQFLRRLSVFPIGICAVLLSLFAPIASAQWMLNTVATFNVRNGKECQAGLAKGADGNFYGVTVDGGTNGLGNGIGYGTVFRVTRDGNLTSLFSFNGTNGSCPSATLLLGKDGNFYGTTTFGGSGFDGSRFSGYGTVFRITPSGDFTSLHVFDGTDGAYPAGPLSELDDDHLCGSTTGSWYGRFTNSQHGTVFRLTRNGQLSTIFTFKGTDGESPSAKLLLIGGKMYGTTWGDEMTNLGTVYCLTTNGELTTLVRFVGTNGAHPFAGLTPGPDGHFYGTTSKGGNGCGTVFRLRTDGTFNRLHAFDGNDGDYVDGALVPGQAVFTERPQTGEKRSMGQVTWERFFR